MKLAKCIFILWVLVALFSCDELEDYVEQDYNIKEIEGTQRLELPVQWEKGTEGGTWNSSFSREPTSYNPFATLDDSNHVVTDNILDYLFDYDPITGEWSGRLIESWEVKVLEETGEMEMICKLRDNIYWSDGVQ
ncbi:MAG: hypothetical protein PF447_11700, partial [Spirochaetaceae bacterium]|nr:hypothetical protein [Spirochaetaceae bacterium]